MDELIKIESKGEVKFTSYVSKLVSSIWNKYFSFCIYIKFGENVQVKRLFFNCGS